MRSAGREQTPAADRTPGREWLGLGVLLAAVSLAVLLPLSGMQAGVALGTAGLVLLFLLAMGTVRVAVRSRRARLIALGLLFCAMAATALAGVVLSAIDAIG
ncbi:hypothetical protein [Leifsonia shinshuensis]|uniref:Uncharacterized protein n=1 Tax=Leifsonia shinshuensis TaxID=150026 RepID=A0A7G6YDY6_9MICO|nr:hypothetical protein [Leifsonia shinshuensis]QNE36701.1 hypothetical protein F1C12_17335 [Leifsonia shinshuensis]